MTSAKPLRICGLGLWGGAMAFAIHIVLRSVVTAGADPVAVAKGSYWIPIHALGAIGSALVLLGLPAAYRRAGGVSGVIGLALLAASWMFFGVFLSFFSMLLLPWLADKTPELVAAGAQLPTAFVIAFIVGLVAWLVGGLLLGIPFIRRRAKPSWLGYLLEASAVWMVVGNLMIAPNGPDSNLAINLVSNMGPVLLMIGLGYLGYQSWLEHTQADGE